MCFGKGEGMEDALTSEKSPPIGNIVHKIHSQCYGWVPKVGISKGADGAEHKVKYKIIQN